MSDHIPFEIQSEIMNMLPVKSLLRFRSICKSWKSLIESSDFIAHHSSQQQRHLLVSYYDNDYEQKYVSIVDDA
ncbi:putative F-box domain-containing protein [Helianthus debilis subsp. tardiflorus]